jgi:hypothetical protein
LLVYCSGFVPGGFSENMAVHTASHIANKELRHFSFGTSKPDVDSGGKYEITPSVSLDFPAFQRDRKINRVGIVFVGGMRGENQVYSDLERLFLARILPSNDLRDYFVQGQWIRRVVKYVESQVQGKRLTKFGVPIYLFYIELFPPSDWIIPSDIPVPDIHPLPHAEFLQFGLPGDGFPRRPQKSGLPSHGPNLQDADYRQGSCKPFEFPLYSEILAALLASLIASWGGWLWAGGNRVRGGLCAVLGLGIVASVLTTVGFCDPLFWRAEWRSLTFQEANRCECQHSEYRQTFQHDTQILSDFVVNTGASFGESTRSFSGLFGLIGYGNESQNDGPCCHTVRPSKQAIPTWRVPAGFVCVALGMLLIRFFGNSRVGTLSGWLCAILGGVLILNGYVDCQCNNHRDSNEVFPHDCKIVPQKYLDFV